jgi:beta-glucosidase
VHATPGCTDTKTTTACAAIDVAAVKAAIAAADVLVFCVGTGEKIESEVVDHGIGATLKLPGQQEAMMALGFASNKPVVVLTFTTSPKNGEWVQRADAILHAGYPQSGGAAALADTLLGVVSPAGRLPVSWPKTWNW